MMAVPAAISRLISKAACIATVLLAVAACTTHGPQAPADAETVALLKAQADRWDHAIVRKDKAAIEDNMADDFRQIDGQGHVETKASFVADLVSPDLVIDPYTVDGLDVRLYGEVALLSGTTRMTGRYQGKPFTTRYRYIDVYVRRSGAWKIVSVQVSKLPD